MSDANRVRVGRSRCTATTVPITAASLPGTQLGLQGFRNTGQPGLAYNPQTVVSNEIRDDRNIVDQIFVGASASGNMNFELSHGAFDLEIESALLNSFRQTLTFSGTTGITAFGAGTFTVNSATGLVPGHIVELTNEAANLQGRGLYVIASIATNTVTAAPYTGNALLPTNALTGSFVAQSEDFSTDTKATTIRVVGFQATANGDTSIAVAGGLATLSFDTGVVAALRGNGATQIGDQIKIAGFTGTVANNVQARVVSIDSAGDTLTFTAQTGMATDTAAAAQVIVWFGDKATNGIGPISNFQYIYERSYLDHSPVLRELFIGISVNQLSLDFQPRSILTGAIDLLGFDVEKSTNENELDNTGNGILYANALQIFRTSAPTNDVMNTSSNIGRIAQGVNTVGTGGLNYVLNSTVIIDNQLREREAVGVEGAASIGFGDANINGTLNTYFDNDSNYDAVLTSSATSYDVSARDGNRRGYTFDMPRIKVTGAPDVPSKNADVTLPLTYQALLDASAGYTMAITRWHYQD